MKKTNLLKVIVDGVAYCYPPGTSYQDIVSDFQGDYAHDILLVNCNGQLRELQETLDRDCELKMITAKDEPGMQTYERSVIFLMLKAFYDVLGSERLHRISVEFSISNALFMRASGDFTLDQKLLDQVEARMKDLAAEVIPIRKENISIDDAAELFRRSRLYDKARLLNYRLSSHVDVYSIDGFSDYFYGFMVPDTSYLHCFGLEIFSHGFVLRLPDQQDPSHLGAFNPSMKLYRTLYDSTLKGETMRLSNVADLNTSISQGEATQLILASEALMEKKIGDIAEEILSRKDVRFVMIAGPSSSGKTTFSQRLSAQLWASGMCPHPIATDNYYKNHADVPKDENGKLDFECLEALDVAQFNDDMVKLLDGETVEIPQFNFKKGIREYNGDYLTLGSDDILVIEGIHCLNDLFSQSLPEESKYKIFISCLPTLSIDDHNRIPTTDIRLLRRIERDARTRGHSAMATIQMWPSVRQGEEENIIPFCDSADVVFNSALVYEIAVLRPYVEPLLYAVPSDCEEYIEAKRLLKFLSYFLPITADNVPITSLAREFIGGGCYKG